MVVAGSIILLIALALYAAGLRRAARDAGPLGRAYYVLVGCLFASVLVGTQLAEAPPCQ
jgi:multisubunit Na+/H+ antiporter MnhB subunit